jgi:hypothetical protein
MIGTNLSVLGKRICFIVWGVFLLAAGSVHAHKVGESYLFLDVSPQALEGRVETTLSDLDRALDLDVDGDGKVSDDEINGKIDTIRSYIAARVKIGPQTNPYDLRYAGHDILETYRGRYFTLHFSVKDIGPLSRTDSIGIEYNVLFDSDPQQRGLLILEHNRLVGSVNEDETVSLIFSPQAPQQFLELKERSIVREVANFVGQGVWHIWIGIDHVLFLLAFILPTVLRRSNNAWEPVGDFGTVLVKIIKIISLFTLAHSITLCLAALEIIQLPSRLVESIIAASVVVAAINNIYPFFGGRLWLVIFGFGLFHGFGFASVLTDLGLNPASLAASLLGFNLGVEIGQVAIIAVAFPLCYAFRRSPLYCSVGLKGGSGLIGGIAFLWFIERAFDLEAILPF